MDGIGHHTSRHGWYWAPYVSARMVLGTIRLGMDGVGHRTSRHGWYWAPYVSATSGFMTETCPFDHCAGGWRMCELQQKAGLECGQQA
eukprot:366166-Chlamydomonas_euryale.AAC.10